MKRKRKTTSQKQDTKKTKTSEEPNVTRIVSRTTRSFALLAYIPFLFFIPLILKRRDAFVRFHIQQGIVLFLFELVIMFLAGIPVIGWFFIGPLGWLAALIFILLGIVHVTNDEEKPLPAIGRYAEKVNV